MRERIAEWWGRLDKRAFAVVMAALGVRLLWITLVNAQPVSDFLFYFLRSGELARGQGYLFNGHPTAYWPPGYPFVLAAFFKLLGQHLVVAKLLNVAMWTTSAWLMYVLGKRIAGPTAGLWSGMLVALFPEYIFYSGLVASENLFVLTASVVAVLLTIEPKSVRQNYGIAAVTGLLLGYGIIIRPASVLLPLTLCFVVWFVKRRERGFTTALVIGLCGLVALAPWVIRNKIVMGQALIATNGGSSVWGGAHAGTTGTFLPPEQRPSWMRPARTIEAEITENREGSKAATQYMREHPLEWLSTSPAKLVGLFESPGGLAWNAVYDENGEPGGKPLKRPVRGIERYVLGGARLPEKVPGLTKWIQRVEWMVGILGLALAIGARRRAAIWPFTILAYWVLFQITFATGQPRYLVSTGPLLGPGIGFIAALVASRFAGAETIEPELPEVAEETAEAV